MVSVISGAGSLNPVCAVCTFFDLSSYLENAIVTKAADGVFAKQKTAQTAINDGISHAWRRCMSIYVASQMSYR